MENQENKKLDTSWTGDVRLNRSFDARLLQANDERKSYYVEILNYFGTFKLGKVHRSWHHELLTAGKFIIGKISFRGKTLCLSLPITKESENFQKYKLEETPGKESNTPSFMRITSNRRVKLAKEIIASLLATYEKDETCENKKPISLDDYPYASDEDLINLGKVRIVKSRILPVNYTNQVEDELESESTEKLAVQGEPVEVEEQEEISESADAEDAEDTMDGEEDDDEDSTSNLETKRELTDDERKLLEILNSQEYRISRSFTGRLIQANDERKSFYLDFKNFLLGYKQIKIRRSWNHEMVNTGRNIVCKISFRGKTLVIGFSYSPDSKEAEDYKLQVTKGKDPATPTQLKITSLRRLKLAKELVEKYLLQLGKDAKVESFTEEDISLLPYESDSELLEQGLAKLVKNRNFKLPEVPTPENTDEETEENELSENEEEQFFQEAEEAEEELSDDDKALLEKLKSGEYRVVRSFTARICQANDERKSFYLAIKNFYLSYRACKCKTSFHHELVTAGKNIVGKFCIRGMTLCLDLPYAPDSEEAVKYKLIPAREKGSNTPTYLKILSNHRVKMAKELIALYMTRINKDEKRENPEENSIYAVPYQSDLELLKQDLIRLYAPQKKTWEVGETQPEEQEPTKVETNKEEEVEQLTNPEDVERVASLLDEEEAKLEDRDTSVIFDALRNKEYRFDRSFTARLLQSTDDKKENYLEIKNLYMSYKPVRSRISWKHELITAGRHVVGKFFFRGKTLCLGFPFADDSEEAKLYKLESSFSKKSNTPTFLRITSKAKVKLAKEIIEALMKQIGKDKKKKFFIPQTIDTLPYETTARLLNAGLIRIYSKKPIPEEYVPVKGKGEKDTSGDGAGGLLDRFEFGKLIDEATSALEGLTVDKDSMIENMKIEEERSEDLLNERKESPAELFDGRLEYKKEYFLRAIDENWVTAIEEIIPVISRMIQNPSRGLVEEENVVSASLSRKVTSRSVVHLLQHVENISEVNDKGEVIPARLLNISQGETILTYENKFLNTLIYKLFIFVNQRYEIVRKEMADEVRTSITVSQSFRHKTSNAIGRIQLRVELSEPPKDVIVLKNYTFTTSLWKRVCELNKMLESLMISPFCREVGKTYIRPPVIKTNAILKNKNLHQCLLMWQYIEGYENIGYQMHVHTDILKPNSEYYTKLIADLSKTYVTFVHNVREHAESDVTLDEFIGNYITPKIVNQAKEYDQDAFDINLEQAIKNAEQQTQSSNLLTAYERTIVDAIEVALRADQVIQKEKHERLYGSKETE